jgi:hypothetical protein
MGEEGLAQEFQRQTKILRSVYRHYREMPQGHFDQLIQQLREQVDKVHVGEANSIAFIIVPGVVDVHYDEVMAHVIANGKTGVVNMEPVAPTAFKDIEPIPKAELYLLFDIDTGRKLLNVSPEKCLQAMRKAGRTPLTLAEGVALVVYYPQILTDKTRYNCFQMPGSRIAGDQRVPSIWMSYGRPRLGWCWDRNIHTWLGSASAAQRSPAP